MMSISEAVALIVMTVTGGLVFYRVVELFVKRSERLRLVEKLRDDLEPSTLGQMPALRGGRERHVVFPTLDPGTGIRVAFMIAGIGLGIFLGLWLGKICLGIELDAMSLSSMQQENRMWLMCGSIFLCGGISLIGAFFVEKKMNPQK